MKSRAIFAGVLSAAVCLSMMTGCTQNSQKNSESSAETESKTVSATSEEQSPQPEQSAQTEQSSKPDESSAEEQTDKNTYTLTIRDNGKGEKMTAHFINTMSGAAEEIPMTKTDENTDYFIYTCEADTTKYNMVHLDYGAENPTLDVAFNEYVSGWLLSEGKLRPYIVGQEPDYNRKLEIKTFRFQDYDKNVYIWTPDDYDADSPEKYSTIYAFDGQWDLADGIANEEGEESWHICEHVMSMTSVKGHKAIVVGIDTREKARNNELIPDLGTFLIKNYPTTKSGGEFSNFLYDTIVPYIESNYNVYTDAGHTAVTGSSLGGLEAFYVAFDHPDKFGVAGAMSPSFWAYDVPEWTKWLLPKLSEKEHPYLYLYGGNYELDNGAYAILMNNALIQYGYPKDKIVCSIYQPGEHLNEYWQDVFPEFLKAMFDRKLSAIENGAVIELPDEAMKKMAEYQADNSTEREATDKDYVYYDNSETKWDKVCAYWWGPYGSPTEKITSNEYYDHDWPGIEMERIGDTDIYRVLAPKGAVGIIFDNGIGDDVMAEGNEAYQTEDITYSEKVNPGQIYKIDMTKEAKPGKGTEKVKYKYPAGEWSDYIS